MQAMSSQKRRFCPPVISITTTAEVSGDWVAPARKAAMQMRTRTWVPWSSPVRMAMCSPKTAPNGEGRGEDAAGRTCPVGQDSGEPFGGGESGGGFVDAAQGLGGFVVACAVGFALVKRADGGEQDADEGGGNQGMAADVFAPFGGGEGRWRRDTGCARNSPPAMPHASPQPNTQPSILSSAPPLKPEK